MKYKYSKKQLFGKRLKVPKNILLSIYSCTLSFNDFIEYDLEDKIPVSCLNIYDRQIVERFGIERSKSLDWELLNKNVFNKGIYYNFRDLVMTIEPSVDDINISLYELIKDKIRPRDYSSKMKEVYSDRLFDLSANINENLKSLVDSFNKGEVSLKKIIKNWNLFKNKDLSYCLQNDTENEFQISDSQLKDFMSKFGNISKLFLDSIPIYSFIHELNSSKNEFEKQENLKEITDNILEKIIELKKYQQDIQISNNEYKELFKYSSLEEHLKKINGYRAEIIMKELNNLPPDYIFNIQIPFHILMDSGVLSFIGTYALKNVIDFDNECGHFFTKNNCEVLRIMYELYLKYAGSEANSNKSFYTKKEYDENGYYVDRLYSKDEFYEAMRRMILYGPNYANKAPDYRNITGEFKERNTELFISEQAPEKLKNAFYTKSITPKLIRENPEYIQYLLGKNLESCFKSIIVKVDDCYENFYNFLIEKINFTDIMKFITQYSDIFDIVFDREVMDSFLYRINFSKNDDINSIRKKINESFRKLIIRKGIIYPKNIPENLRINCPSMFLNYDAPKELQEVFYNRTIDSNFILSNSIYKNYLKDIDLEILYKYMPVKVIDKEYDQKINLLSAIKQFFGPEDSFDVMLLYGKYIESVFESNSLQNFKFNSNFSKDDLLDEIDSNILQTIIDGKMKYDENIPRHFKNNNPTLFLSENIGKDIRNKFYNREFTIKDFIENPSLLDIFENTNVVCGFPEDISWMITLFHDSDNKVANYNRLKVISAYSNIQDDTLKNFFKQYIMEFSDNINIEKIEYVSEVLSRLSLSNSSEMFNFRKEIATQLLKSSNPIGNLNKIEDMFIRNNIPNVGKIYSCFEILHPDFEGFNFKDSMVSPVLKKNSNMGKKSIIFSDLIKSSFGSNNRSVNDYLKNIEYGSKLYEIIKNGQVQYDSLDENQKNEIITFSKHLSTLYNNTQKGKKENELFQHTDDVLSDILELSQRLSPNGTLDYNLADRVISMFCHFAGIDTLEEAKNYIHSKINTANIRNRNASNSAMILEKGDFIKGIGDITYLKNILQNGSVSKEYLGSSAGSDLTPLDTDVSMITESDGTIPQMISKTVASGYGPILFVLKNDDRFITTRTQNETLDIENDMSKMEVFYTGARGEGHYGIRTGFASSEINYIVMEDYDPRVGLEIAMNGFYIPVANKEGKIIFTPNDYDKLREKMNGLSYYDENNYVFSENLIIEDTTYFASKIEDSNYEVQAKKTKISEVIKKSLEELGLHLKTTIDGDLTEGFVELIDTGSTSRGTNKPGDGDFDFMMRLDKTILSNPIKLEKLKSILLKNLGKENSSELTGAGDFRLKEVLLDNKINVDIDITFTEKTDKISYSTDMALQDRLSTIQKTDPEKYKYVIANVLLAKQVLKQGEVYKPNRGEIPQGGLGGIGIENWILQNGGSFIDAAQDFLNVSEGKSFEEFKKNYYIWDFGKNHLAERRGDYSHDNFVTNNMSESGYYKMVQVLKEYINTYHYEQENSIKR